MWSGIMNSKAVGAFQAADAVGGKQDEENDLGISNRCPGLFQGTLVRDSSIAGNFSIYAA